MKSTNILNNPYSLFSPFLVLFIIYVFIQPTDGLFGDQPRYIEYAHNLIHGFYSKPAPNIRLINGPGYPIIIMPFLALKLPLITIALLNPLFYYFSIIFLYKALEEIVAFNYVIIFSIIWACYFIAYQNIPFIHTESFTYLLISMLAYFTVRAFRLKDSHSSIKYTLLSGFIFGYLVLTKMIFGHILVFMLLGGMILRIINKNHKNYRKGLIIISIAFLTTLPYLLYTYHLTGRMLYWGMGSDSIFWMTTPYKDIYGDWTKGLDRNPYISANYNIPGADSVLKSHHKEDFNEINKYTGIERDDAFKKLAIRNIKSSPLKYAQNIFYNMGRLVFHYPFSQAIQKPKTLLILPINGVLLTLMIFSFVLTILNWRKIEHPLKFLLIIAFLYLGASTLVTALVRMFTIIVPILLLWIAYICQNTMKINLKFKENTKSIENNTLL